jgi:glycosyltransferase involved in cell wall biosynthesis
MTRRLRFLHVTTFYPPYAFGGDGAYVHRLAHALADAGHDVDVLHSIDAYHLRHPAEPDTAWPGHSGVTTHGLRSGARWLTMIAAHQTGRPLLQMGAVQAVFDRRPYDVIHFHNISLFGPGVLSLAPRTGAPLKMYTTHEHWLICPTHVLWKFGGRPCEHPDCLACTVAAGRPPQWWRYTGLIERATAHVDVFLSPSRFTADMHAARGFHRPFEVLPLFVDVDGGTAAAPRPHDRPYFLFVGRLERIKGVESLLRAFATVSGADLLIVGAGSEEARIRLAAAADDRVHVLGQLPQRVLGPLYAHAIACCVPSQTYEPFPTVAIEALARGTAVIVRDLGGGTEIVEQSGGGILYRQEDELAAAMRALLADDARRTAMGARGRQTSVEQWSRAVHLARYFALIETAMARKHQVAS